MPFILLKKKRKKKWSHFFAFTWTISSCLPYPWLDFSNFGCLFFPVPKQIIMLVEHFWILQKVSLPPCAIQPPQPTPSLPVAILMPRKQSDSVFNISEQSFNNSLCGSSPLQKKACLHSSADFNLCLTWQRFILILVLSCEPKCQLLHPFLSPGSPFGVRSHFRRRQWHPTPVFLPGKSPGWRSLVGCSPWGCWESDTTERLHFHFSLPCTGEGNGNPLQCSCLENPRDRGAWWAAVCGVAQSRTRLKQLSSSSSSSHFRCFNYLYLENISVIYGSIFPTNRKTSQEMIWRCGFEFWVRKTSGEENATHSSILAWRIPWTEEPGGCSQQGLAKIGHDWANDVQNQ